MLHSILPLYSVVVFIGVHDFIHKVSRDMEHKKYQNQLSLVL